jgi:hypothetical protein
MEHTWNILEDILVFTIKWYIDQDDTLTVDIFNFSVGENFVIYYKLINKSKPSLKA